MSGGHITGYHSLPHIAEEIERLAIEQPELGPDVLGRYRMAADMAIRTYEAIRAVDYLEGGDYGRESFVKAWDEYVKVAPSPQPSADVVVVPREIVQKAHDWIDRGAMSREANTLVDELRRALRSSTNHDAQDAGEGR